MFCANQDFGNQFYFVAQQTKTKIPDLQTSNRHKTSEPPPKHWSNLQDDFSAKPKKKQTNIENKNRICINTIAQRTKPEHQTNFTADTRNKLFLKTNGVATKAPPITSMTLLATTFFVLKSTSFYKSTFNNKLTLKS